TDPNGAKTTFDHDGFGRPRRTSLPGGGGQSMTYARELEAGSQPQDAHFVMRTTTTSDGGGQMVTVTNRVGQLIRKEAKNLDGSSSFITQDYNDLGLLSGS